MISYSQVFLGDMAKVALVYPICFPTRKRPSLLLKVDISRAFDSVSWPFLLEVIHKIGFPNKWLDCTSTLLSTASTRVMLNCSPGQRIYHASGLRQGDPLSLMHFLLIMEVLNAMIRKADDWNIYQQLGVRAIPMWMI
jgi:hypothetical protein